MRSLTSPLSRSRALLPTLSALALASGLALTATAARAQYKVVGPDGSVTYTDKPQASRTPAPRSANGSTDPSAAPRGALPPALQAIANRYPVTLYTTGQCAGCDLARTWLKQRGVPYAEYTIGSNADVEALQSRFNARELPVVSIGRQVVRGFNSGELQSWVDAAGYPASSQLGAWQPPPPQPLVAPQAAAPAAEAASVLRRAPTASSAPATESNDRSRIRF